MYADNLGALSRVGLALAGPGLRWGGRKVQEGRDISPILPSPNYGFVILLPLEQEWSAPPHPSLQACATLWEVRKGKPLGKKRPAVPRTWPGLGGAVAPHSCSSQPRVFQAAFSHSEVDP